MKSADLADSGYKTRAFVTFLVRRETASEVQFCKLLHHIRTTVAICSTRLVSIQTSYFYVFVHIKFKKSKV